MRRGLIAGLLGVAVMALMLGATPASTQTAAPSKPLSAKEARKQTTGCKTLYTRRQHRRYVTKVYRASARMTKPKHQASYRRTRCQHTVRSERIARKKWHKEKRRRVRILSKGNSGIGYLMVREWGWNNGQFQCLVSLMAHESGWSVTATNPDSGAYGIPQALPPGKMAYGFGGPKWRYDARTQIRWMLGYIRGKFTTPCGAWGYWRLNHSY